MKCFFFGHQWTRIHTHRDGISFIEQCDRCGKGRFLRFLGHASIAERITKDEVEHWKKGASNAYWAKQDRGEACETCRGHGELLGADIGGEVITPCSECNGTGVTSLSPTNGKQQNQQQP